MESAGVWYLCMSCWRIRNRTSEHWERVRFLIRKQEVRIYPHKALSMWYCVYYVHTETFIILEVFFFNLFKMLKFATTYCEMTNKMKLLSLHLILFSLLCFLLPCCLASSLQFSSLREYTQNYSLSISEVFLTFLQEKLFNKNFSFYMCAKHSQSKCTASCKCLRQELWYETHTPLWLLIARIIFLTHEKTLFTILIRRIIFFTCEKHCLLLWLVRTHLHMNIYDMPS